jgi:hypothetical protein
MILAEEYIFPFCGRRNFDEDHNPKIGTFFRKTPCFCVHLPWETRDVKEFENLVLVCRGRDFSPNHVVSRASEAACLHCTYRTGFFITTQTFKTPQALKV